MTSNSECQKMFSSDRQWVLRSFCLKKNSSDRKLRALKELNPKEGKIQRRMGCWPRGSHHLKNALKRTIRVSYL